MLMNFFVGRLRLWSGWNFISSAMWRDSWGGDDGDDAYDDDDDVTWLSSIHIFQWINCTRALQVCSKIIQGAYDVKTVFSSIKIEEQRRNKNKNIHHVALSVFHSVGINSHENNSFLDGRICTEELCVCVAYLINVHLEYNDF